MKKPQIAFKQLQGDVLARQICAAHLPLAPRPKIAVLPMGFCYPGTGKSGDLPPRPECAEAWRQQLSDAMPKISLTLVIGL